ncbi:ParB N-terminal domain-containing protein [Anaerofustis stercorihominis]|uniref:ParB N-terminal domain-containing protein n=1 Tax=Anaerofustis stercorihominis TaxID=214853 RepID=UPI0039931B44
MKKIQVVHKNIDELKRYKNNPRINDKAISYVANSIKRFGFLNPIIIDKNDEIIAGDTRIMAAYKLNLKTVPCIYADDLNEEEVKAFRLADNKVSEIADWDYTKLDLEMESILNIDMLDFGFEDFNTGSIIDDLLSDDMFQSVSGKDKDYFSVSFVFKKEYEKDVNRLIKEKGKDYIVETIINLAKEEE